MSAQARMGSTIPRSRRPFIPSANAPTPGTTRRSAAGTSRGSALSVTSAPSCRSAFTTLCTLPMP